MLINGIDLASLGVKLYDRVISSNQVSTTEAWLEGDIQPTAIRQQDSFKSIKLAFLVLGKDEDDAFVRISNLTNSLKKATLKFDDLNYYFDVSMTGKAEPERLKNGNFIVRYSFSADYAKGEREVYTTNANLTNAFKLTVLYYQNSTTLLANEIVTLRASAFEDGNTLAAIGIDNDKYRPDYYNTGVITNLGGKELTYENLQSLGTLIINYPPIKYNLTVSYCMDNGSGAYVPLLDDASISFTYPQLQKLKSIGQLIDVKTYKPDGYKGKIAYNGNLTVENLLAASPIYVFYDKIDVDKTKNITITYYIENDNGEFELIDSGVALCKESDVVEGTELGEVININAHKPEKYYNVGIIEDHSESELVTYEDILPSYIIKYTKQINTIFVEYYAGVYPSWYRLTSVSIPTTYKESYETNFNLSDIGLDLDKYHTAEYQPGALYNGDNLTSYEQIIAAGVLQVYYNPINYTIQVKYQYEDGFKDTVIENITINALDFMGNPVLGDVIPLTKYREDGYQFSAEQSYNGAVELSALLQVSPIEVVYEEVEAVRTKNIIVKYKQEMSSAYATINTSIITINEADCAGGVRLKDIINLNLYQPEFYEKGVLDGASSTELLDFNNIDSNYSVIYLASEYSTPIRYYTDDIDDKNWVGSSAITYKVIDFTSDTTLYSLGLNINLYKPSYSDDGILQYNGPVNFKSLRALSSINILYESNAEPGDDSDISYPHRFLFLEHNDLGEYENAHPNWTMNHAYINTGVSVEDMSKLTVVMECGRVDENVPLHNVISGYGYLFGSESPLGSFFMRFNNQTQYGKDLTGVNTYEAQAGLYSDTLVLAENSAIGFSGNSGIYAIEREGYSTAVFTYSNTMASEHAQMPYPLYLFANNKNGAYADGLAGIGIYSCRIYYDGTLIRDLIPVQFYDKIGDKVAPSNCLYDKITGIFFEDATNQNSFNIRDDERYIDIDLSHKIGHCYVQYYKGDEYIQTIAYYFRASDFEDQVLDPYTKFEVDTYQPAYYKSGEIQNFKNLIWDFDNMSNNTYTVIYPEQENLITVNYYAEDKLLATETKNITEQDFLSAPTFGDLIRINKYKPEGYGTDFEFSGAKVSLKRVVEGSPYNIVYSPVDKAQLKTYTTVVQYIKKVYGIRTYETIGTEILTFDDTMFRDGEYIDFYIDKNKYKPDKYYIDGAPYQWYEMDERLNSPEQLKDSYTIWYGVDTQYVDINYYTDSVSEENLIASTSIGFNIDDFEPGYKINLTDSLPNEYINKYKPANCEGGVLQNSSVDYTFEELTSLSEIVIIYTTKVAPHDPTTASYEQKVLYWGKPWQWSSYMNDLNGKENLGGTIPYIDLGFKPKDLSRLRVEIKAYARPTGFDAKTCVTGYGFQEMGYTSFFGYEGPRDVSALNSEYKALKGITDGVAANGTGEGTLYSPNSKGFFSIRCRVPVASGWVYSAEGPQYIDGQIYYTAGAGTGVITGSPKIIKTGVSALYRKGCYSDFDDEKNVIRSFNNYGYDITYNDGDNQTPVFCYRDTMETEYSPMANPYTVILDAYNKYMSVWREEDSNTPMTYQLDESSDNAFFENVCQPKGTLSLFQSTNPDTGKVNIMPFDITTFPNPSFALNMNLSKAGIGNPYNPGYTASVVTETKVVTGLAADGTPIYETKSLTKNINYMKFAIPVYPQMSGCAVWSVKIYDRDRLVRDMIPVAKGDMIYDYVMPENGLFDLVTEIFFGNSNQGGDYSVTGYISAAGASTPMASVRTIKAEDVMPLQCMLDPTIYGKTVTNYYDFDNSFISNQYVNVPTWFNPNNVTIEDLLAFNDYKPDDFHLDGLLDIDKDLSFENMTLKEIFEMGVNNVYYKLRTFTKTIVYYQDNVRIGSKDLFYTIDEIKNANSLGDLGIDVDLFYDENFKHGRIVFDESIIASNDIKAFIDAPSPIVVYDKYTQEEKPELFYCEYYRGGAYDG